MDQPTPRRLFLQAGLAGIGLAATVSACSDDADDPPPTSGSSREPATPTATATSTASGSDAGSRSNVLLVYFSRAGENYFNGGRKTLKVGNTEVLANMIADRVTCDVYRIEAADPYPEAYEPTVERNVQEESADARPRIAGSLPDLADYDTVLVGSPIWNTRAPMIMSTFTEGVDLAGKTVLPFVTYAVSGMSGVDSDYRTALPDSQVRDGLAVRGEVVSEAASDLEDWLSTAGLA